MTKFRNGAILIMFMALWGCSSANDGTLILDATGKHPAGWAVAATGGSHPAAYRSNQSVCDECHGSAADKNSSGGISGVSCFSASRSGIACHPGGPSNHPAGWSAAGSHGTAAKAASPGLGNCTLCHGSNFSGGSGKSCMTCHATAPHPAAPWRATTASGTTHTTANEANAAECARCHLNSQRLTVPQPVPAGTTPGCFNNTLCHGPKHPAGWSAPASHGAAAKAAPDASHGLSSCTQCHNSDFVSGPGTSCKTCHTSAPHPAAPWRGTTATGTTHTTADQGNASECSRCHAGGAKLAVPVAALAGATCFNNTLCHGNKGHAFPNPGALHRTSTSGCSSCHALGTGASAYPVAASVPPDCKSCHKLSAAASMNLMTGCSDCHGDAATGRPNGTLFPNRLGQHSRSQHVARACTVCHPFTTGDSRHGWSNRVKSTAAQVGGAGTSINSWNPVTKSCSPTCHGSEIW